MKWDAVIGCTSVDAGTSWLRLHSANGLQRTIPWTAITIAGLGGNHGDQYTCEGVTETTKPFFPTHDSLWIVYADGGFVQAMIERTDAKRDAILAMFAQQLGPRWRGDQLTLTELMDVKSSSAGKRPFPKALLIMIAFMLLSMLIPLVLIVLARHQQ
jgi:hypothetical protein